MVFGIDAKTDSRPCVFPPALLAVGLLSLACARESNQREHTLAAAVAGEAGDFASALRRFADSTSLYRQRTGPHPAGHPLGFFLRALAAPERGPGNPKQKQNPPSSPRKRGPGAFALLWLRDPL